MTKGQRDIIKAVRDGVKGEVLILDELLAKLSPASDRQAGDAVSEAIGYLDNAVQALQEACK